MTEFVYRYTCKGCGALRAAITLRELTADQKRWIQKVSWESCPVCRMKEIMKGDGK